MERLSMKIQVRVTEWAGSVKSLQSTLALITMRTEFTGSRVKCTIMLLNYLISDGIQSQTKRKWILILFSDGRKE